MKYTLWDTETSNSFGAFEDEKEVLALVRTLVDHYGEQYADDLGLGRVTDEGKILPPLSGIALITRAKDVLSGAREERRSVLIASSVQTRKGIASSIEPMAASAKRRITQLVAGQRRMQRG